MSFTAIALISPLYAEEGEIFDGESKRVATIFEVSNPQELQRLQPANLHAENVVIDLLDWQVCLLLGVLPYSYLMKFVSTLLIWPSSTACQLTVFMDLFKLCKK